MKLTKEGINQVLAEYREAVEHTRLKEPDISDLMQSTSQTLLDYYTQFPEGTEFEYQIRRHFTFLELRILIPGEAKSLYEYGNLSRERDLMRQIRALKPASFSGTQYLYFRGKNILFFFSPPVKRRSIIRNPIILAMLAGVVLGLLCSLLPENISGFLIDDVADQVLNIVIKMMTGIMGPIMFVSLVVAISTLGSINEFSRLGTRIFRRFLLITILFSGLATVVSFLVFAVSHGQTDLEFSPRILVDLTLSVVPLSLVTPFVENNFPQLMVLGIVMGLALLLINKKESLLGNFLMDFRDWINEVLRIILKLNPLIPGLTLFRLFAKRDFSDFLKGWKYIVAVYICMILALLVKIILMKIRCRKIRLSLLFHKIRPILKTGFLSGSEMAAVNQLYDVSEHELGISKSFTGLWIPLNQAMFAPIAPIYYVTAPFFIAELTGTPVSISFVFILLFITVELSMAYPGSIAGITIIFKTLGLSAEHIGMFSAYSVFIKNAATAYGLANRMLEITELSFKTDNINLEQFGQTA